ncbi:MAG: ABC transporter ATP-binding protein/permease [Gallicola sp.]|nr:ABC transporter ATP-binding protein/permease [Gallicola sp.]
MLQLKNISKRYKTGTLIQEALKDINLNFRKNEFVAILGPSGSGKTTLLNIVGGLDQYDTGKMTINGVSTKDYKDRDWDSYRNHSIGFVFQSYNLIPHQSVLKNVELALTISGVSRRDRKRRAKNALSEVGLEDHIHKKPNQMSGGQMQRVAIARALVNNPDILLADEPTGALDSETSVVIMDLLKEVAKNRLVIMVTHNPDLAHNYANRTIKLRDGQVVSDTNPYSVEEKDKTAAHKIMGKASMSFFTSLQLSFNNLRTKKGRTLLTAFAGSMGIIGIALILALSSGVNTYITDIQKETMTSYPITIEEETVDLSSFMDSDRGRGVEEEGNKDPTIIHSDSGDLERISQLAASFTENNLSTFKNYLEKKDNVINEYIGENGVHYSYNTNFRVFSKNDGEDYIDTKKNYFIEEKEEDPQDLQSRMEKQMTSAFESAGGRSGNPNASPKIFEEMLSGRDDRLISPVVTESYELLAGHWPKNYREMVLVLGEGNEVATEALYGLGMISEDRYTEIKDSMDKKDFEPIETTWNYEDILGKEYSLVYAGDFYKEDEKGHFVEITEEEQNPIIEKSEKLMISAVIRPIPEAENANLTAAVGYTNALTEHIIKNSNENPVVQAQLDKPERNIKNGVLFDPENDEVKLEEVRQYIDTLGIVEKARLWGNIAIQREDQMDMASMMGADEAALAAMLDQYMEDPEEEVLLKIYEDSIAGGSYEDNMKEFGYVDKKIPSSIRIYADSFEDKEGIAQGIQTYNEGVKEDEKIVYTDLVGLMTSSITNIINVISYVLIAFVAVSLIVSSIMIGIITYISVMERRKEIGILRAIGASKKNISQVFNAETFIIGLVSGLLGVGISLLLTIPINKLIHQLTDNPEIKAYLPVPAGVLLIVLSIVLTLIGGLFPAKAAAKKDPVKALRTE